MFQICAHVPRRGTPNREEIREVVERIDVKTDCMVFRLALLEVSDA